MNGFILALLLTNILALLLLPRRWAPMPLLVGACYFIPGNMIEFGPFHFSFLRIFVLAGVARIIVHGERLSGPTNGMDKLVVGWSMVALITSVFHRDPSAALIYRLGIVYDFSGIYFLVRILCQTLDDIMDLCRLTAILLLPVALEMLYEKVEMRNLFYSLEGYAINLAVREGHVRAQGPFAHAILAGTVGAICLPLIVPLWRQNRTLAVIGLASCFVMIFASSSSGPILTLIVSLFALSMWRYRESMRLARWLFVVGYILLDLVMKAPAYFLIARIDLAGGSTGFYRARLIQSAFDHLSEWWLKGTDVTRHWMPSGVAWSAENTDITNQYLQMGVWGGLPLLLLFIALLVKGFSYVGKTLREKSAMQPKMQFMMWALGASLFADTVTFISVCYYDQSSVFLYLTLAAISTGYSSLSSMNPDGTNLPMIDTAQYT